jgi:hypothetical protein
MRSTQSTLNRIRSDAAASNSISLARELLRAFGVDSEFVLLDYPSLRAIAAKRFKWLSISLLKIIADPLTVSSRGLYNNSDGEIMKQRFAIGILLAALTCIGSAQLSAQGNQPVLFIPVGETVSDVVNHVTWLANGNLAGQTPPVNPNLLFGLKLCDVPNPPLDEPCVNASGTMNYPSAQKWILGMNAYLDPGYVPPGYLGHGNWQLPTTPNTDHTCKEKGPLGNNFGFGCTANALAYLYNTLGNTLGFVAPDTAVTIPPNAIPIPPNTVGPFNNFQPSLYWSDTPGDATSGGIAVFSFATGAQGGSTKSDYLYVLPMIKGDPFGTPPPGGTALYVNPGSPTVYDPGTNRTWLLDADLASTETFDLAPCTAPNKPSPCVAKDGSMNYDSAVEWIKGMNDYKNPSTGKVVGYLNKRDWRLPPVCPECPTYGCEGDPVRGCVGDDPNPMGNLYYGQLKIPAGTPIVEAPDIALGPFNNIQPSQYWSCVADNIPEACEIGGEAGGSGAEFGFSFGDGFLGTTGQPADHFVTAYYPGCDPAQPWCQSINFADLPAAEGIFSSLALSATATSGLAVSLTSKTPEVCAVHGNSAYLRIAGTCTIEASQAGDDTFVSALPVEHTVTVNGLEQTITFPPIPTQEVGDELQLKASASSGLEVAFKINYYSSQVIVLTVTPHFVCGFSGSILRMSNPGTCSVTASQAGNDFYAPAKSITRDFTVLAPQ